MKFSERQEFSCPWGIVQKMFSDPAYFESKAKKLGRSAIKVEDQAGDEEHFRIRLSFEDKPNVDLPAFAERFIGKRMQIVQEDSWDWRKRQGRLLFQLKGVPVKLSAEMQIADTAGGCVNVLNWQIVCTVPLVGGTLEKVIAADIQRKSAADLAASRELLENYKSGKA